MAETANPQTGADQEQPSVQERLLAHFGGEPEAPEPEQSDEGEERPVEAEQPEAQVSDEVTESDLPDDEAPAVQADAVDEFEIVHNGAQHKLPRAEVIKLAQQGFDYTQKTMAVADLARQASERLQKIAQLEQVQPHLENSRAQVAALQAQLQQYDSVDWVQIATNDPLEYPKYRAQYDTIQRAYQQAHAQYQQQREVVSRETEQLRAQMLEQEARRLPELIPAWKDPAKFEAAKKDMQAYLRSNGADEGQVGRYLDNALAMKVLWQAAQYEKLQKGKAEKVKQLRTAPPVSRPGASSSPAAAKADTDQKLRSQLKKTGDLRDAAALFLNRMK